MIVNSGATASVTAAGVSATVVARAVFEDSFRRQVPAALWENDPAEAERRAKSLRAAHFCRMTAKSIEARRKRSDQGAERVP